MGFQILCKPSAPNTLKYKVWPWFGGSVCAPLVRFAWHLFLCGIPTGWLCVCVCVSVNMCVFYYKLVKACDRPLVSIWLIQILIRISEIETVFFSFLFRNFQVYRHNLMTNFPETGEQVINTIKYWPLIRGTNCQSFMLLTEDFLA